ncbi:MAG: glycosyltransferase family 87 protein [Terrimicrobiaceae bacterium]
MVGGNGKIQWLGDAGAAKAAWIFRGIFALVLCIIVAVQPDRRTVTPEYRKASEKWWASQPGIYTGKSGFLYLPQAAIFYTPIRILPQRVGEPLWRLVMLGSLAGALWWGAKRLGGENRGRLFLFASLLVLPASLASARNGQVNMPLAALYLFAALCIAGRHWWVAAVCLALSLGLKPISLAPMLLAAAAFPRLIWPLVVCTAALLALPFAHPDSTYVLGQYRDFLWCLSEAGRPTRHSWCDLAGMLRSFGWEPGQDVMWGVRAVAAVGALVLALRAAARPDPLRAALSVFLVGAIYLMLFNPRTETNSYVIIAAFIALAGAYELVLHRSRRHAAVFIGLALVWGTENFGWPIFPLTNLWLKALCTVGLMVWLAPSLLKAREPQPFLPPRTV